MRLRQAPVLYGFCRHCYAEHGDTSRAIFEDQQCGRHNPLPGDIAHCVTLDRLIVVDVSTPWRVPDYVKGPDTVGSGTHTGPIAVDPIVIDMPCYVPAIRLSCGQVREHFTVVTGKPPPPKLDGFWSNYYPMPDGWPGDTAWQQWEFYRGVKALLRDEVALEAVQEKLQSLHQLLKRRAETEPDPKRRQLLQSLAEQAGAGDVREFWSNKVAGVRCPLCGGGPPDRPTQVWIWESWKKVRDAQAANVAALV